jgi:subtilase family serine protease
MRSHSFLGCATVLCAVTATGLSQTGRTLSRPQDLGSASPNASTHFSVYLPLTNQAALEKLVIDQTNSSSPSYHKWLTPAQFKAQFGPNLADKDKVKTALERAGFTVVAEHTQSMDVEGTVSAVERTFSTRLNQVRMPKGDLRFSALNHRLSLPAELAAAHAMIPSFAPHLAAHVHSEHVATAGTGSALRSGAGSIDQRLSTADSFYYPNDMKEAYDFPSFTTSVVPKAQAPAGAPAQVVGLGAKIGILMSSTINPTDVARSFNSSVSAGSASDVQNYSGNTTVPVPTVTVVPVDGGSGAFSTNNDAAGEASLDTQMSLGTAPGAKEYLYNIPDLADESILDGYSKIVDDNIVDVVSSSFGECEVDFIAAANGGVDFTYIMGLYHNQFVQGNAEGITFIASSGDNGAVDCTTPAFDNHPTNGTNYILGVENPASDPNVTGVGGTNLTTVPTPTTNDAAYSVENANYDPRVPTFVDVGNGTGAVVGNNTWGSGGGYSIYFAKPSYQNQVNTGSTTVRAVPDVSLMMGGCPGDADLNAQDCTVLPRSAAIIWIDGVPSLLIGTSSSSPQMAGVIALSIELQGSRLGNINPQLYTLSALQSAASGKTASASQFYHRNISGNNNGYTVSPGQAYSPVLGNGTLFVKNFLQLQSVPVATTPSTVSNP